MLETQVQDARGKIILACGHTFNKPAAGMRAALLPLLVDYQ
jgi:hypothetical protein